MRLREFSQALKEDFERLEGLHWAHLFFFLLAITIGFFSGKESWLVVIKVPLIVGFYHLFTQTKKNLNYSFWTFAIVLSLYFLIQLIGSSERDSIFFCYSMALILLLIEMSIFFSPIYYPIVSWWEYDFRFRHDLKILVKKGEEDSEGRLTDLRRGAGCVASFKEIPIGESLLLNLEAGNLESIRCEVMSRRQYSVGRPYHYGVKFSLANREEKEKFHRLSSFWRKERKEKTRKNFK